MVTLKEDVESSFLLSLSLSSSVFDASSEVPELLSVVLVCCELLSVLLAVLFAQPAEAMTRAAANRIIVIFFFIILPFGLFYPVVQQLTVIAQLNITLILLDVNITR